MARYKPDYKYKKAKKVVEKLGDGEEEELIKYYLQKKEDYIDKQNRELDEYRSFFRKLNSFLPRNSASHILRGE